jgi:chromosome segregation ATPase
MEEILAQLRALTTEVKGYGQKLKTLENSVNTIKEEYGQKLSTLESTVNGIKEDHSQKLKSLESSVNSMIEEHGQILRTILEKKETQKAELDNLKQNVTSIAGVLKGFGNSLDILKKVD